MTDQIPTPAHIERLLSNVFATPVSVAATERIAPWSVLRCRLAPAGPHVPASVIVKWLRTDPAGFRIDPAQVHTEMATLQFLQALDLSLAPRLIASDVASNLLVLEDLFPRRALDTLLRESGAEASRAPLQAFARTLGAMHATTAAHAGSYYARRRALGPVDPAFERQRFLGARWPETRRTVEELGVEMAPAAEGEMVALQRQLAEPGPFPAFSNGDAGANNFLIDDEGDGRLIDFEFAGYRHALTDVACFYVPGPMWITVGDPLATGIEAAYRQTASPGILEAADERAFGRGLAASCLAMAIERLHRLPTLDSRAAGDTSRAQMVSTLESAAAVAEGREALPALAAWSRLVAATLRKRWPDADLDFAAMPPYTPRR